MPLLKKGHYYRAALGLSGMELLLKSAIPETLEGLGFADVEVQTAREDLDDAFLFPEANGSAPLAEVSGANAWVAAQYTADDADHALPPQVLEWRDHGFDDKDRPRAPAKPKPSPKPGPVPATPPKPPPVVTPVPPPVVTPVDPKPPGVKPPGATPAPPKTSAGMNGRQLALGAAVVVLALGATAAIVWYMSREKRRKNPRKRRKAGAMKLREKARHHA